MDDSAVMWVRLAIRCVVAALGAYVAAVAAGAHGVAAWGPPLVAALTTAEAGISRSPGGPVQMQVVNAPQDPVPVEPVAPGS